MILIFLKNLQNQKESVKKEKKALTLKNTIILLNGKQNFFNAFEGGIFPKEKEGEGLTSILYRVAFVVKVSDCKVSNRKFSDPKQLKILTPKQMFQRLPIALAQVKAGNTS